MLLAHLSALALFLFVGVTHALRRHVVSHNMLVVGSDAAPSSISIAVADPCSESDNHTLCLPSVAPPPPPPEVGTNDLDDENVDVCASMEGEHNMTVCEAVGTDEDQIDERLFPFNGTKSGLPAAGLRPFSFLQFRYGPPRRPLVRRAGRSGSTAPETESPAPVESEASESRELTGTAPAHGECPTDLPSDAAKGTSNHGDDPFITQLFCEQNEYRRAAGLSVLTWDDALAGFSKTYLFQLDREGCAFHHSSLSQRKQIGAFRHPGENLYRGKGVAPTGGRVAKLWYDEIHCYRHGPVGNGCTKVCDRRCSQGSISCQVGHFTQLMWQSHTHMGCARHQCRGSTYLVSCHYGNIDGMGGNVYGQLPFDDACRARLNIQSC